MSKTLVIVEKRCPWKYREILNKQQLKGQSGQAVALFEKFLEAQSERVTKGSLGLN